MPVREIQRYNKYLSHSDLMPFNIAVKWNYKYAAIFTASALSTVHKNPKIGAMGGN
jgi:hypothetical protein